MCHISRVTNISHHSGWSTRQPVELLHQPDNSRPLLQSQSSCAAETERHSRHLLQVLLLTPLSCTTKNSWRCKEEEILQERYNANLWVAEPLQYKLYSNQQLCRFQREECKVIVIVEEKLFKICPHYVGVGERVVNDERFVIHLVRKTDRQVLQYSFSPISQTHKDFPSPQCHASKDNNFC